MDSRLNREAEFHNKTYESDSRDKLGKYYAIARKSRDYYENFLAQNCANKKVLEYGCGEGSYGYFLAKKGASVSGIALRNRSCQKDVPFL